MQIEVHDRGEASPLMSENYLQIVQKKLCSSTHIPRHTQVYVMERKKKANMAKI